MQGHLPKDGSFEAGGAGLESWRVKYNEEGTESLFGTLRPSDSQKGSFAAAASNTRFDPGPVTPTPGRFSPGPGCYDACFWIDGCHCSAYPGRERWRSLYVYVVTLPPLCGTPS